MTLNKEMNKEEFQNLEDHIWKTYQSRIKAANRMLKSSKQLEILSTVYTICLTILSVFSLVNSTILFNYITVGLSIAVMGFVFFGNTMNFHDRYLSMKQNYLQLGDLYYKCLVQRINGDYDIDKIYKIYSDLLKIVENHTDYDYKKFMIEDKTKSSEISVSDKKKIKRIQRLHLVIMIILYLIPVGLVAWSICKIICSS